MVRNQNRLGLQQEIVAPGTQVITVLAIQRLCACTVYQIPAQVPLTIGAPLRVGRWQFRNPQADAYAVENIIELTLLVSARWPNEQLVRALGVIDEHVEHVAVGPIRNGLAALVLDGPVNRPDPVRRVDVSSVSTPDASLAR